VSGQKPGGYLSAQLLYLINRLVYGFLYNFVYDLEIPGQVGTFAVGGKIYEYPKLEMRTIGRLSPPRSTFTSFLTPVTPTLVRFMGYSGTQA
jgi:hypothetical protein